jgi:hypothetical protein
LSAAAALEKHRCAAEYFRHKRPLIYNAIRSLTLMQLAATLFSFLVNSFAFLDLGFSADDSGGNKNMKSAGLRCTKNVQSMPNAVESANPQTHKILLVEVKNT